MAGTFIRSWLPPPHLSKESQDVVRLGMGLVATMTALLLGLVTASAKSTFDTQDNAIRNSAANILTLDRHLARYGPETAATRDLLRRALADRVESVWPARGARESGFVPSNETPPVEEMENQILRLSPENDTQRWFKSEALKLSEEVVKTRWRILGTGGGSVPRSFLVVVIFWLTVTFASFGLYAPRNGTVLAVPVHGVGGGGGGGLSDPGTRRPTRRTDQSIEWAAAICAGATGPMTARTATCRGWREPTRPMGQRRRRYCQCGYM